MRYYMLKLKFTAPVHFGADVPGIGLEKSMTACHADTLFSALCQEALYLYGPEGLDYLVKTAEKGNIVFSDLMPFRGDDLYIPRPLMVQEVKKADPSLKKKLKKVNYIRISDLPRYLAFLDGKDGGWTPEAPVFGAGDLVPRVAVSYREMPLPYLVGTFTFEEGAGLYVIIGVESEEDLDWCRSLFDSLGYAGLGGKRTSGFGAFTIENQYDINDPQYCYKEDKAMLAELLHSQDSQGYIALSLVCPAAEDWPVIKDAGSAYTLIQRRGFVQSVSYSEQPRKRRPLVMIGPGSFFPRPLKGRIVDTGKDGTHPVYRYGRALMMGVKA